MRFKYKAQNKKGAVVRGEMEAEDKFALARQLKKGGKIVLSVREISPEDDVGIWASLQGLFSGIRLRDKILFARNLSAMIDAGLPLSRALAIFERQTRNERLKSAVLRVMESIKKGSSFHEALKAFPSVFSPLFVAMMKAGEESGKLSNALAVVGKHLEKTYLLHRRVRGALMYPAIIVLAMIIIGILMLVYVVPTLSDTFEDLGVDLPPSTQMIIFFSEFLKDNPIISFSVAAFAALVIAVLIRTHSGRAMMGTVSLRLPVIGDIVKKVNAARTARTLSSLLSSGVGMVDALSITEDVLQNPRYKEVLREAGADVQKGAALSKIFMEHEDIYPVLVGEMIAVGEETGQLSEMLVKIADFFEGEVEQATKDLSTIIEPVLMIIIGAVVGFFAFSMITPLYTVLGGL